MNASLEAQHVAPRKRFLTFILQPRFGKAALIVLGILPALILLADIRRNAVNVPFMDDWQFVPLLEKAKDGTLTFQELWAPHDEHRLLLPRTIIIAAMFATGGDYRVQSLITFAVVAVISGCLLWLMLRLNGTTPGVLWTWVLANIALFSPIQFHNWLWPMQFAYFLPYTFLALCLCALYARIPAVPKFVLAAIFALAGNYSFVQGNLIWLAMLPVILFAPGILPAGARRNFAIAWAVVGVAAVARYFLGLEQNAAAPDYAYGHIGVPPTLSTLQQLRDDPVSTLSRMGRFILGMFGNAISRGFPVADNLLLAQSFGAVVLLLAVAGLGAAWRRGFFAHRALPWACLLLFTFLTAAFVCVGRVWRGDAQPLTPRYTTFGAFCIVSLLALLSAGFSGLSESSRNPALGKAVLWSQGLFAGLYLTLQVVNWTYGQHLMAEWNLTRWRAVARLHFLGKIHTQAKSDLLGGADELIRETAKTLEKLDMLKPPQVKDLRISALGEEERSKASSKGSFEQLTRLGENGWRASGFALFGGGRAADAVILGTQNANGEWIAIAAATPSSPPRYLNKSRRMDWEFLAVPEPQQSGRWEIDLPDGLFAGQEHGTLRAWAMDFRKRKLYRLPGDRAFEAPGAPQDSTAASSQ
jgi:hypothetical protein